MASKLYRVRDYDNGGELEGAPSDRLIAESAKVDTGAVASFRDAGGVWVWVPEVDRDFYRSQGERVRSVYVEEIPAPATAADRAQRAADRRNADRIDGYDRDDLGESPDF